MRHTFEDTEERCKVCGGRIQKVSLVTSLYYATDWTPYPVNKAKYSSQMMSKLIGHRCSDCGIQYLILEER